MAFQLAKPRHFNQYAGTDTPEVRRILLPGMSEQWQNMDESTPSDPFTESGGEAGGSCAAHERTAYERATQEAVPKKQYGVPAPPREELRALLVDQRQRHADIAELYQVSIRVVERWVRQTGLKKWGVVPPYEVLHELYWIKNKPMREIADEYGVSIPTVRKWFARNGLMTRTTLPTPVPHVLKEQYERGISVYSLARKYVTSRRRITELLLEAGTEIRDAGRPPKPPIIY